MDSGAESPAPATAPKSTKTARRLAALAPRTDRHFRPGYSRFVGFMKFALPAVAIVLIAIVAAWPYMMPEPDRFTVGISGLRGVTPAEPSVSNARYFGVDRFDRPFSVTADLAKNVTVDSPRIELEFPKADITLEDGTWVVLTAETGIYSRGQRSLELTGNVNLFHDSGYEFQTSAAFVQLADGVAWGDQPVHGQGPFGYVDAEGFRLDNENPVLRFTGKSKVVIRQVPEDAP